MVQTADEFAQLLSSSSSDGDTSFVLFPEGYMKLVYACYAAIPQTAYDIWNPELHNVAVGKDKEGHVVSLSISLAHSLPCGFDYAIEMYGDIDHLTGHLHAHLPYIRHCKEMYGDRMVLAIIQPAYLSTAPLHELFHRHLEMPKDTIDEGQLMCIVHDQTKKTQCTPF